MNKEVIYIDTEDDITSIIGKVKTAGNKIVALVPPKRIGALQSAVNLKLLQRAALAGDKRVVLITNDHSLTTLAAGLKMPVAKNLQSRPEIPQMTTPEVADEEIIDGKELPVGEVASSLGKNKPVTPKPAQSKSAAEELDDQIELGTMATAAATATPKDAPKKSSLAEKFGKGKLSVPNFDIFRKRLFIFGGLGVLLIVFLVWALVFAPRATITISAKTTDVNIDRTLTLNTNAQTSDPSKFTLKPSVQQLKKAVAAEFQATGKKDIGNSASGTITITNCEYTAGFTIAAGTLFTAAQSGLQFKSTQAAILPGYTQQSKCNEATRQVQVQAVAFGPEYNVAAQAYTIANISGNVDAGGAAMSGGTREQVTVVSQEDVDKAKQQLGSQNVDAVKGELKKLFNAEHQVIEESFTSEQAAPAVSPNVGEQATNAKVTVETTYTFVGVMRSDLKTVLTDAMTETLRNKSDQQIYTLGENSIVFRGFEKIDGGFKVKLVTTGSLGPKIDTKELAKQLVGKRFGEIQAIINQIPGVNNVDITFSPFWVTTAPAADKIDIKFSVKPS